MVDSPDNLIEEDARRGVIVGMENRVLHIPHESGRWHPATYLRHDPGPGVYCFVAKGQTAINRAHVIAHRALFHLVNPTRGNGLKNLTAFALTPVVIQLDAFDEAEHAHRLGRLDADEYRKLCHRIRWRGVKGGANR